MLFVGETLGKARNLPAGRQVDIAVDPLECTSSVAFGRYNAMSVAVAGAKDTLLSPPDDEAHFYMSQICTGPKAVSAIDLEASVSENILKTAKALGKPDQ